MPRAKTKSCPNEGRTITNKTTVTGNLIMDEENATKQSEIMESSLNQSLLDLNKFKFEKRPPVKIEFEKATPDKEEGKKGLWEPSKWHEFLLNLRNMRANNDAPVDSMGCHMSMDENAPPEVYRYQCLISLMLSSQTKDQVTFAAMERLRARGLTVDNILLMDDEELGKLIYPVGFWRTKVKYIKKTTQTLKDQYNSDIPDSVEKLCKLTGVGPKMAHICMKVAWDKVTGIGVDTHVHRISNRIGWLKKPTTTPEDTRKALQSWLPFDLWSEVNHLMVGFGQTICTPIGPNCQECLNNDICPSSDLGRKSHKKSPVKIEKDILDIKSEHKESKSPKKRNVTTKKENDDEIPDNENDFKTTNVLNVGPISRGKPSAKKSPVKTENTQDVNRDDGSGLNPPRKRKITPKQQKINTEPENEMDDFKTSNNQNIRADSRNLTKNNVTPNKLTKDQQAIDLRLDNIEKTLATILQVQMENKTKSDEKLTKNTKVNTESTSTKPKTSPRVTRNQTQNLNINVSETDKLKKSPQKRKSPRDTATNIGTGESGSSIKGTGNKKNKKF